MTGTDNYPPRAKAEVTRRLQDIIWDHYGRDVAYVNATDNVILLEFTNDDTFEITVNKKA